MSAEVSSHEMSQESEMTTNLQSEDSSRFSLGYTHDLPTAQLYTTPAGSQEGARANRSARPPLPPTPQMPHMHIRPVSNLTDPFRSTQRGHFDHRLWGGGGELAPMSHQGDLRRTGVEKEWTTDWQAEHRPRPAFHTNGFLRLDENGGLISDVDIERLRRLQQLSFSTVDVRDNRMIMWKASHEQPIETGFSDLVRAL